MSQSQAPRAALAALVLLGCLGSVSGGACATPKTSFSGASQQAVEAWAANASAAPYNEKRVALLMALHPPKFGDGLAFLRSCRIAEAAREVDVYVLFSSEADKRVWDRRAPPTTVVASA